MKLPDYAGLVLNQLGWSNPVNAGRYEIGKVAFRWIGVGTLAGIGGFVGTALGIKEAQDVLEAGAVVYCTGVVAMGGTVAVELIEVFGEDDS